MNPNQVHFDAREAEAIVAQYCERTGREVKDEYTAREAVEMLADLGYDVSLNTLREFVAKGYIADHADAWTPVALYALTGALDSRRRWQPTPCVHDARKSAMRLMIEQIRAEGIDPPIHDIDGTTLEDLLLKLVGSDHRGSREALYEAVKVKMDRCGFVEE